MQSPKIMKMLHPYAGLREVRIFLAELATLTFFHLALHQMFFLSIQELQQGQNPHEVVADAHSLQPRAGDSDFFGGTIEVGDTPTVVRAPVHRLT